MHLALPYQAAPLAHLFGIGRVRRPRITHWFATRMRQGATRAVQPPRGVLTVHCREGEAWITHDGDPRDVLLQANEKYVADSRSRMTVHALKECVVEFEVTG